MALVDQGRPPPSRSVQASPASTYVVCGFINSLSPCRAQISRVRCNRSEQQQQSHGPSTASPPPPPSSLLLLGNDKESRLHREMAKWLSRSFLRGPRGRRDALVARMAKGEAKGREGKAPLPNKGSIESPTLVSSELQGTRQFRHGIIIQLTEQRQSEEANSQNMHMYVLRARARAE